MFFSRKPRVWKIVMLAVYVASCCSQDPWFTTMVEPHTPTSLNDLKSPILGTASSVDEVAKTRELFGEIKQPLHKINVRTPLSLVCIILRSKLFYRLYSMGYMTERLKWLHWLIPLEQNRK